MNALSVCMSACLWQSETGLGCGAQWHGQPDRSWLSAKQCRLAGLIQL